MKIFFDTNVYVAEALLGKVAEEMRRKKRTQLFFRLFSSEIKLRPLVLSTAGTLLLGENLLLVGEDLFLVAQNLVQLGLVGLKLALVGEDLRLVGEDLFLISKHLICHDDDSFKTEVRGVSGQNAHLSSVANFSITCDA
jgi:hypothetical protein